VAAPNPSTPSTLGSVLIVTGPPGSGKTTVASVVADHFDPSVDFESDWFWRILRRGAIEPWLPESHRQNRTVLRSMAAAAVTLAQGGYHVVLNGIIGPWQLDLFLEAFTAAGTEAHYTVLRPSLEITLERATSRSAPDLVDEVPIRSLWEQFSQLGPYERHALDNSALDVDATVTEVLDRYRSGRDRL
jgi:predicted kinase